VKAKLKNLNLALFFTKGMSLAKWAQVGMLEREVEPYNELAKHLNKIYMFTYGDKSDLNYKKYLADNIEIIYKNKRMGDFRYSFLMPNYHKNIIKNCHILKSLQMLGAWSIFSAKRFAKRSKFILRTGYTLSLFDKKKKKYLKYFIESLIEKMLYKKCDYGFVASAEDFNYVVKKYKIKESKLKLIPNYININVFKPKSVSKINNRIVFVGRLNAQKNLFSLITALKDTGMGLDIIGKGELEQKLKDHAKKNKVDVKFLGAVPNHRLPDFLNKYDFFILPSYYEGMPKTLLEAMSCGLVCIGTNVSGIKEVIKHNSNGYLCKTDSDSIKNAILEVAKSKKLQKKYSSNARQTILKHFSLEIILKKEIDLYRQIFSNKTGGK